MLPTHRVWLLFHRQSLRGVVFIILLKPKAPPFVKSPQEMALLTLLFYVATAAKALGYLPSEQDIKEEPKTASSWGGRFHASFGFFRITGFLWLVSRCGGESLSTSPGGAGAGNPRFCLTPLRLPSPPPSCKLCTRGTRSLKSAAGLHPPKD